MDKANKICGLCNTLLRLLALGATLSAAIVMAKSHQTTVVLNIAFEAKFSNEPAFVYFIISNVIVAVYTALALCLMKSESKLQRRFIVGFDVIATLLLTSTISAALAVGNVGKKGNTNAGWLPICGQVEKFCGQVTGALISGFIGMICYLLVLVYQFLQSIYIKS